jgi:hypothetical protein
MDEALKDPETSALHSVLGLVLMLVLSESSLLINEQVLACGHNSPAGSSHSLATHLPRRHAPEQGHRLVVTADPQREHPAAGLRAGAA